MIQIRQTKLNYKVVSYLLIQLGQSQPVIMFFYCDLDWTDQLAYMLCKNNF